MIPVGARHGRLASSGDDFTSAFLTHVPPDPVLYNRLGVISWMFKRSAGSIPSNPTERRQIKGFSILPCVITGVYQAWIRHSNRAVTKTVPHFMFVFWSVLEW